eukprot:SAG31_NODE_909_length_11079_cov_176.706102_10_plen_248_part_00
MPSRLMPSRFVALPPPILLLRLLFAPPQLGAAAAAAAAAASDGAAARCSLDGAAVPRLQQCSGLHHCAEWNGRRGPESGCGAVEALALAGPLVPLLRGRRSHGGLAPAAGSGRAVEGTACYEALRSLDCALAFSKLRCIAEKDSGNSEPSVTPADCDGADGQPRRCPLHGRPCLSMCHTIVDKCNRLADDEPGSLMLDKAVLCNSTFGFGPEVCGDSSSEPQSPTLTASSRFHSPPSVPLLYLCCTD